MATNDNKKKPLVTLDAANPVPSYQDYAAPSSQVGAGWAGNQSGPTQQTLEDNTPSFTYEQVQQMQNYPGHLSEANKVEAKPSEAPKATEVWENTPEAISYDKMFEEFKRLHPTETDDEKRARLKRQRRNQLFAAIGDGISALSDLYFTTKGAPKMEQAKTLSQAVRERYDKEDNERKADEKSNLSTLLSIMNQKRLAHASWLNKKNQEELLELKRKATEAGNVAALRRIEELRRYHTEMAQIEREKAEAERKRKAENDKQDQERKDKLANSRIGKDQAAIAKDRSAAGKYSSDAAVNKQKGAAYSYKQYKTAKNSGRGGNQPFSHTRTITGYENGKKVVDTYKDHGTSQPKPKKKLRKNNMGL